MLKQLIFLLGCVIFSITLSAQPIRNIHETIFLFPGQGSDSALFQNLRFHSSVLLCIKEKFHKICCRAFYKSGLNHIFYILFDTMILLVKILFQKILI